MPVGDYTDILGRFSDPLPAETLAKFIAGAGFSCDLVELSDDPIFSRCYGVRVARSSIADLKEHLKLTPLATYNDAVSAQIVAGRLARENIPCYTGGPPVTGVGPFGIGTSGVPIDDDGKLGINTLAVPNAFVSAARRVLGDQVSDAELTKLSLDSGYDPQDPP